MSWWVVLVVVVGVVVRTLSWGSDRRRDGQRSDPGLLAVDAVLATCHDLFGVTHVHDHVFVRVPVAEIERLQAPAAHRAFTDTLRRRVVRRLLLRSLRTGRGFRRPRPIVTFSSGSPAARAHGWANPVPVFSAGTRPPTPEGLEW
ncbi:MAG TPA: hypothetical protein VM575_04110 [Nocardioides sp.]|nr:hypothetical protein [Nocardioides sp.]